MRGGATACCAYLMSPCVCLVLEEQETCGKADVGGTGGLGSFLGWAFYSTLYILLVHGEGFIALLFWALGRREAVWKVLEVCLIHCAFSGLAVQAGCECSVGACPCHYYLHLLLPSLSLCLVPSSYLYAMPMEHVGMSSPSGLLHS
jgi:hypothetical protein